MLRLNAEDEERSPRSAGQGQLEEQYLPASDQEVLQLLKQLKLWLSSPWKERGKGKKNKSSNSS